MSVSLTYGSVCSGIEAASLAWEPLGLKPLWFAEIEDFPSHVLAQRWPSVPNLGDMTTIAKKILSGEVEAPDVLVGGTPCQAFSIAGLRQGLNDERGLLTLKFVELADAIDTVRAAKGLLPVIIIWENVPGVLSSHDNAFGNFTAALVGEPESFEPGERPARGKTSQYWTWNAKAGQHVSKWSKHGAIAGRQRRLAWAIKDAQYFGVAQRRRRCFVIASARNDLYPSEVLFESGSVPRDIAPSRGSKEEVAGTFKARAHSGGWSQDVDLAAGGYMQVVGTIAAHSFTGGAGGRPEGAVAGHFIPASPTGSHWDNPLNPHPTLNQSHNTGGIGASNQEIFSQRGSGIVAQPVTGDITHTLKAEGFDGSEDGIGRGRPIIVMAHGQSGAEIKTDGSAPTLTCNHEAPIAAYCLQHAQIGRKESAGPQGKGWQKEVGFTLDSRSTADAVAYAFKAGQGAKAGGIGWAEEQSPTLTSASSGTNLVPAIAFAENSRSEVRFEGGDGQIVGALSTGGGKPGQGCPTIMQNMVVRRLTPRECERLQGFPDDWTLIPYGRSVRPEKMEADYAKYLMRGGNRTFEDCCRAASDGPRYKAIGNSMAVPVMRWLMKGILSSLAEVNRSEIVIEKHEPERSIFKWAGGKFGVLPTILPLLPCGKRLIEPFVGGGAVFTNAGYGRNLLNDVNSDLINAYKMLALERHSLITLTHSFFSDYNSQSDYEDVRAKFNGGEYSPLEHAAAFIYLNRHCFNGLTRYNLKKEFNVGYGKYKKPYFPLQEMEAFLGIAERCEFVNEDFEDVIARAGDGDVVFCDPPYEPLPGTAGFTRYSGAHFTFKDQIRLVEALVSARSRGAYVVITNSASPKIRELYNLSGFSIHQLAAKRSMSCKGDGRVMAHDIIATLA